MSWALNRFKEIGKSSKLPLTLLCTVVISLTHTSTPLITRTVAFMLPPSLAHLPLITPVQGATARNEGTNT